MKTDTIEIKNALRDHYDESATAYHQMHYTQRGKYSPLLFRQHYCEQMVEDANLPAGASVLDVGCGPGELLLSLARKGYEPWGIDISSSMVRTAREVARQASMPEDRVNEGDIEALGFEDGFFDAVIAAGVIEYQKDDDQSLHELYRVLKPRGVLILNVTNRFALLNLIDEPYRWLKRHGATRAIVGFIKSTVLRKGPLGELPERRTHNPGAFNRKLAESGFEVERHNYFHFSPLPTPLDSVFKRWCHDVGHRWESLTTRPVARWLAGGYLVTARKVR